MKEGAYLVICDKKTLTQFIKACVHNKYLRSFDLRDVAEWINTTECPVWIKVNDHSVIDIISNAGVKTFFGANIEKVLTKCIKEAMGGSEN